jgi:hypothetical protein
MKKFALLLIIVTALATAAGCKCGKKKTSWEYKTQQFSGQIQSEEGWEIVTCKNTKEGAWECVMKHKVESSGCGCGG